MPSRLSATVPERAGQPEPAGDQRGELGRRRGDQPDPLAGVEVQLRERAGAGPDPPGHQLVVDLLAEAHDLVDLVAGDEGERGLLGLLHVGRVLDALDAEGDLLPGELREVAPGEEVARGQPTGEVVDRRALHHRVVDVEERRGRRVGRHDQAGFDLGGSGRRRAGQRRARGMSFRRSSPSRARVATAKRSSPRPRGPGAAVVGACADLGAHPAAEVRRAEQERQAAARDDRQVGARVRELALLRVAAWT